MAVRHPKTSYRQLLLLVSCAVIALPALAGPALCLDCECCSAAANEDAPGASRSSCCCEPPAEAPTSCCEAEPGPAVQHACRCQHTPPAPQPRPVVERTDNPVSSQTHVLPTVQYDAPPSTPVGHDCRVIEPPPKGPAHLRSVVLLI